MSLVEKIGENFLELFSSKKGILTFLLFIVIAIVAGGLWKSGVVTDEEKMYWKHIEEVNRLSISGC
jgi:CDP-diacylglycerol pyrophosphatase